MKTPRDLDGAALIELLSIYGYQPTRQTGSHVRVTTEVNGEHHVTIPMHRPLKVGTLSAILRDVAAHLETDVPRLKQELFQ